MLGARTGARRFDDLVTLTWSDVSNDDYGKAAYADPAEVMEIPARVSQMSAGKAMMTYQQADIIGLDIEIRTPSCEWNGLIWHGHNVVFDHPVDVDGRGRLLRISGYYQQDNPSR